MGIWSVTRPIIIFALILNSSLLLAMNIGGSVRIGVLTSKEKLEPSLAKESSNDHNMTFVRALIRGSGINRGKSQFTLDLRSKYNPYGTLDAAAETLAPQTSNIIQQASFEKLSKFKGFYYKLGVFPIKEAGINNAGMELGIRTSRSTRYSVFVGQEPTDNPDRSATKTIGGSLVGVHLTTEPKKKGGRQSRYMSNAIIRAPNQDLKSSEPRTWFYHNAYWQIGRKNRLFTNAELDLSPNSSLQHLWLSWWRTFSRKTHGTLLVNRIDTTRYEMRRNPRDALVASPVITFKYDLRQKISPKMKVMYSATYSRRDSDGLAKSDFSTGFILPRYLGNNTSVGITGGVRNNFRSSDLYIKAGANYYSQNFDMDADLTISQEKYITGENLSARIIDIWGGYYISKQLQGGFGAQSINDGQANIQTLMITIGYRFGKQSITPHRTQAPDREVI